MPEKKPYVPSVGEVEPYRYSVTCWRDDCPGSLDTYGGAWVLDYAKEHVAQYGCSLTVHLQATIEVVPNAL